MAKRYYNLEKETKAYLKECADIGIPIRVPIKDINDYVIFQKNVGLTPTSKQLIQYALKPVLWVDSSLSSSYRGSGTAWVNLINSSLNITLPATASYANLAKSGAVFLNNGQFCSCPWSTLGLTNNFSADFWITVKNLTGIYTSGLLYREAYQNNGFRCGITASLGVNFWSSESGGNFNMSSGSNSIILDTPVNITITYDSTTRIASIYINGVQARTQSNATIVAPPSTVSLSLNSSLNSTSTSLLFHNFKLYNRALTQPEITESYNALSSRFFS